MACLLKNKQVEVSNRGLNLLWPLYQKMNKLRFLIEVSICDGLSIKEMRPLLETGNDCFDRYCKTVDNGRFQQSVAHRSFKPFIF